MADNYLQFCTSITLKNDQEIEWWKNLDSDFNGEHCPDEGCPGVVQDGLCSVCGTSPSEKAYAQFQIDKDIDGTVYVALYSEEYANIDKVAYLIQSFLRRFDPKGYHWFTWAETCNKMRDGEFSGGGVFITADKIKWFVPSAEIDKCIEEFTSKNEA